jgi:hypothetical protein
MARTTPTRDAAEVRFISIPHRDDAKDIKLHTRKFSEFRPELLNDRGEHFLVCSHNDLRNDEVGHWMVGKSCQLTLEVEFEERGEDRRRRASYERFEQM